jgi:hypothetical protein
MSLRDMEAKYPHMNLRWTMAQMDRIIEMAAKGHDAEEIAFVFDVTATNIRLLCQRNGIHLKKLRREPAMPKLSIQQARL